VRQVRGYPLSRVWRADWWGKDVDSDLRGYV